jgi:Ner family transcriptional regulator
MCDMSTPSKQKKASKKDWHRADIKAALEKADWSYASLAIHHGYDRRMAQQAIYRPYPRAERLIADAIGVPPHVIWPSRYDARGNPNQLPFSRRISKDKLSKNSTSPLRRNANKDGGRA